MKLIVGLGNPGKEYQWTPHNIGRDFVNYFVSYTTKQNFSHSKIGFEYSEYFNNNEKVLLCMLDCYMNESGDTIKKILSYYKLNLEDLLVIHDEADLEESTFKFAFGVGPAGHNGVASIQEALGTKNFARLRVGIGRPLNMSLKNYVLDKNEQILHSGTDLFPRLQQAVDAWLDHGLTKAMNVWNAVKSA